jgi:CspA family cold shock protein
VVREYHADEGWGVIDGPTVPGGCWVHFSAIAMAGYRQVAAGRRVSFRAEAVEQVWTDEIEPVSPGPPPFDEPDGGR